MKRLTVLSVGYPLAAVAEDTPGGAEQILALLDAALVRAGHASIVVAPEGSTCAGRLLPTTRIDGPLTDAIKAAARAHHRAAITHAIDRFPVDVVHLHGVDFWDYVPAPAVPVLVTLHLPPSWYPAEVFHSLRRDVHLCCVSDCQRRGCPDGARIVATVPNGVPVERFDARRDKDGYVVALGRICPEKGFHLALDAARRAGVPLVLAGELFRYAAHEAYFEDMIVPRLDAARRFVGRIGFEGKRELLARARCLLVPSVVAETSCLVAMEAMASGTPVVAFRSGALVDLVEHGRTGFLVDGVDEMADAIAAAGMLDPRECRRVAEARCSADAMTSRYIDIYDELAGRRGSGLPQTSATADATLSPR